MHKELPMQHEYLVCTDFTQFESFEMYQLGSKISHKKILLFTRFVYNIPSRTLLFVVIFFELPK